MDKKIIDHFRLADPILHAYIEQVEEIAIVGHIKPTDFFASLCREIVGQQLSGKAATSIFNRFLTLFPKGNITASEIIKIPDQKIRDVGLSWSKVKYLKDLAQKVENKTIDLQKLPTLSDKEVIDELTKIKGIGPWTAEMFLMFVLGREDIFSHGDLGLAKGIQKIYNLKKKPTIKQVEKIVKKWSPYKSYASRILWKSLELK